jgi:flagellar biosynthesis protein FliQ
MNPETIMSVGGRALEVALIIAAPMLIVGLVVGLLIGAFQAATSINEQTLSFIPKLVAMSATIVIAGPWMLKVLISYTKELFTSIPSLIN